MQERRGVIDRFEGDLAAIVFDDNQRLDLPRDQLPRNARAGDAIIAMFDTDDALVSIAIDAEDTAARKARVKGLLNDIFKHKPE
jgi:transcription elongation factor